MVLKRDIVACFKSKFNVQPLVVASPGRINIIGEHTDYNEGFVFPAAINKHIIVAISKSNSESCTAYAFDKDETHHFSLQIDQPISKPSWFNYVLGVVEETKKLGKVVEPFNVVFGGDIPHGAGLSSSAALETSIVFALNELFDLGLTKYEMITIAQKAEHNYVGVKCGIMDQFACMFGVKDHALLLDCRSLDYKPFKIDLKDYVILLINSNVKHNLAENAYNERRDVCEKVARKLNKPALRDTTLDDLLSIKDKLSDNDYKKAHYIIKENIRVQQMAKLLEENDLTGMGELLFEAHAGMKDDYKITCEELDFLVEIAKAYPQVLGARMIGGGFGGCTINIVKSKYVDAYIEHVKIAFLEKFSKQCSTYSVSLSNGTKLIKDNG